MYNSILKKCTRDRTQNNLNGGNGKNVGYIVVERPSLHFSLVSGQGHRVMGINNDERGVCFCLRTQLGDSRVSRTSFTYDIKPEDIMVYHA